jgi:hypothetical protein
VSGSKVARWPIKHKRVAVSIQVLMVLVGAVALEMSWFVKRMRDADVQHHAVDAIRDAAGDVWYDWEWQDGKFTKARRPWWREWLVRRCGIDCFDRVICVSLEGAVSVSDAELAHIGGFRHLEELNLQYSSITNESLVHLERLIELRSLDLSHTAISDNGMVHLSRLASLRSLNLDGNNVSDDGLAQLSELHNLEELRLQMTAIGDASLAHVGGLSRIRILDVADTGISDRGLVHLSGMKRLELLDAAFTQVTVFGAQELRRAVPRAKVVFSSLGLQ